MIRILAYVLLAAAFALVLFFGLGPVLLADGGMTERITTLIVVLILLGVLIFLLRLVRKTKR